MLAAAAVSDAAVATAVAVLLSASWQSLADVAAAADHLHALFPGAIESLLLRLALVASQPFSCSASCPSSSNPLLLLLLPLLWLQMQGG